MEKRRLIFLLAILIPIILIFLIDLIIILNPSTRYNLPKFNAGVIENSGFIASPIFFLGIGGYLILFCISLVFCYFYYKNLKKEEPTFLIVIITSLLSILLLILVLLLLPPNSDLKCKILVPSYEGECHNANLMNFKELAQQGELGIEDCNGNYGCILNLAIAKKDISICDNVKAGQYLTKADCISVFNNEGIIFCDNPASVITEAKIATGSYPYAQMTDNEICKKNNVDDKVNKSKIDSCEFLSKSQYDYYDNHPGVGYYIFNCSCLVCP